MGQVKSGPVYYGAMGQSAGLEIAGWQLQVPQCIVVTAMRPDMELYSECERIVYFIELIIPFEDATEEASERKKLKYVERGWHAHTRPVEINKTSVGFCF